jgi:ATP dependent DNA ligase domain
MLAYKDRDRVRLVSRNGRDHTRRFADIAAAIAKLSPRTLVLDGEVAIFDQQLRSRFEWLREPALRRSRHRRPSWRSICYIVTAATSPLGRFVIGGHGSRGAQHADAWRDGCSLQCHGRRRGGDCRARHDGGEALHRPGESVAFD